MAFDPKEALFGGLAESTFSRAIANLQGIATTGTSQEAQAAVSVLVSLAQSEHAAAVSSFEVRIVDAVFKCLEIDRALDGLSGLTGVNLVNALAALKTELDKLALFWKGQ